MILSSGVSVIQLRGQNGRSKIICMQPKLHEKRDTEFMTPDVHDDCTLEKGRYIEDTKQKCVCNLVHLVNIRQRNSPSLRSMISKLVNYVEIINIDI